MTHPINTDDDGREHFAAPRQTLLYVVTEDWFFVSHFIGVARLAAREGFNIVVATRLRDHEHTIRDAGFRVVAFETDRSSIGLLSALDAASQLRRILAAEKPDIVHAIALKPIVMTALASLGGGGRRFVFAATGLGYLWVARGIRATIGRLIIRRIFGWLRDNRRNRFIFENNEDPISLGFAHNDPRVIQVNGAGVPAADFPPLPDPGGNRLRVAVVARMVLTKGIADAIRAVELARELGLAVELELWGLPDDGNPQGHRRAELESWSAKPGITWRGRTETVQDVWRGAHVAMLLSHGGEGLPRSLIEAAACARPIVTTNTPGCRTFGGPDAVGALVEPHDPQGAAASLMRLADAGEREKQGRLQRARFEASMTSEIVNRAIVGLYRQMVP